MKTIDRLTVACVLAGTSHDMRAMCLAAKAINAAADDELDELERLTREVAMLTCGIKHPMYGLML